MRKFQIIMDARGLKPAGLLKLLPKMPKLESFVRNGYSGGTGRMTPHWAKVVAPALGVTEEELLSEREWTPPPQLVLDQAKALEALRGLNLDARHLAGIVQGGPTMPSAIAGYLAGEEEIPLGFIQKLIDHRKLTAAEVGLETGTAATPSAATPTRCRPRRASQPAPSVASTTQPGIGNSATVQLTLPAGFTLPANVTVERQADGRVALVLSQEASLGLFWQILAQK